MRKSEESFKPEAGNGQGSLKELLMFDEKGRCTNAYNILSKIEILSTAYMNIKSEPGNMTPGINEETLDGISEK